MDPVIVERLGAHPLAAHLDDFLTDRANAGVSAHTRRAYRGDLIAFAAHHGDPVGALTAAPIRAYLAEIAYVCGARASEVCGLYVEDLDLRLDDEHVRIHGKGGSVRTVLLDDRGYVALLKLYLARSGYTAGPLFRASINGAGGPLSYDAAHHRWQTYCATSGVEIDIHQLRHAHATELINAGVSLEAVRRRLGHASTETTQLYALLDDKVADAEIRAARRRRDQATR
jgi:integrase/recombinase XerD